MCRPDENAQNKLTNFTKELKFENVLSKYPFAGHTDSVPGILHKQMKLLRNLYHILGSRHSLSSWLLKVINPPLRDHAYCACRETV